MAASRNPQDVLNKAKINLAGPLAQAGQLTFPTDLPPIHINILETSWKPIVGLDDNGALSASKIISNISNTVNTITKGEGSTTDKILSAAEKIAKKNGVLDASKGKLYRLPLPTQLNEVHEVHYGEYAFGAAAGGLNKPASAITGMIINEFKSVTMDQPLFKRHSFTWKLAPKTFQESENIQRIVYNLKKGMSPKRVKSSGGTTLPLLGFPNIYVLFFMPNSKFLYKFKPCVLTNIQVSYTGGSPAPAFYRSEGSDENKAPESIQIDTQWLEMEYWLDGKTSDFKAEDSGLPTSDPLDAFNHFSIQTGTK
jgi:hypothetical protein